MSPEDIELLRREAERTGASTAELIRRAIRAQYGRSKPSDRREALRRSAAAWTGREFTGADYARAIRGDLRRQLDVLGLA